jgi:hypothetical protein
MGPNHQHPRRQPLTGHTGAVLAVGFDADGRPLLASARDDHTVRLWDPTTGTPVLQLRRRTPTAAVATQKSQLAIADPEGVTIIEVMDSAGWIEPKRKDRGTLQPPPRVIRAECQHLPWHPAERYRRPPGPRRPAACAPGPAWPAAHTGKRTLVHSPTPTLARSQAWSAGRRLPGSSCNLPDGRRYRRTCGWHRLVTARGRPFRSAARGAPSARRSGGWRPLVGPDV